ncbi:MAG: aminotransferase class I/II-fold pyridoxal phosphate-dependent enzyme [Sporomusaceae bacterium]|nr:aminotransferase class I/II-fold pyridoxal phosphate-dependent enzyme [Sporomusaceae bacterium]
MTYSIAANHAKGKCATDNIFGANAAAVKAVSEVGKEKVANATIGAILNDQEQLACLPAVETAYRALTMKDVVPYAPIAGLPSYLEAATALTFEDHKPDGYMDAIATSGGSGVIHHTIWNYSEMGDTVLTSDWYWGPYNVLCKDMLRKLDTFTLFDDKLQFNLAAFETKVKEVLAKQKNLIIIINSPAHNPTGYSLTNDEWQNVLTCLKEMAKDPDKNIILLVDIAYIDYAGEKNETRSFMSLFGGLPKNILTVFGFSMSKGYTMYGQRVGAMIGLSSDKGVIQEFVDVNQYTSRATWSNINRSAMQMLANIYSDKSLLAQVETERTALYHMIRDRADLFMAEAKEAGLYMLPYRAGFFLTIPAKDAQQACELLKNDYIFGVPMAKGIRIAVCAVPKGKMVGMAAKIAKAVKASE